MNTTPKKTSANSIKCEAASPPIPDLRLEAKKSAEVSHHVYAVFYINSVLKFSFDGRIQLVLLEFGI